MDSLIYPTIFGENNFSNILLIDSSVPQYQQFVNSANSSTFPIVYSNACSKTELETLLQNNFTNISRIAICFASSGPMAQMFLDSEPFFNNNEVAPFSNNVQFMISIIKQYNVQNIDFLACNTLKFPNWVNYYSLLESETTVVGASNDRTGNIKYGGDWVMESTSQNIELIYFTKSIEYYQFLLDLGNSSFVILNDDTVYGCGANSLGQLGNGTADWSSTTTLTAMLNTTGKIAVAVACSDNHTIVLMSAGTVYGCGANSYGQLGNGTADWSSTTTLTAMLNTTGKIAVAVACSNRHTIVLMQDGTVYSCGANSYGQLGNGTTSYSTTTLTAMTMPTGTAVAVACGSNYTIVLMQDGTVYGCGYNGDGQLGLNNTITPKLVLTAMTSIPTNSDGSNKIAVAVACGNIYTIVLMSDGTVYGCGYNGDGQLGLNNTITPKLVLTAMTIPNGKTPVAVACGESHTIVLMQDGSVYGCGANWGGQLGNGTSSTTTLVPMTNTTGKIPVAVACGRYHTIVLMQDGSVYGCGANWGGQLGNGTSSTTTLTSMTISDGITPVSNVKSIMDSLYIRTVTPVSNICFPAKTPIVTNQGIIHIDKINPEIHTIRNKKIVAITKTVSQDKYLICFEKDALGTNMPSQKTLITKNHEILYKGKMTKAKDFLQNFENVKKVKYSGEVLYNVLMETHNKMVVNNLICETLHPENTIAKLQILLQNLNQEQQQEIVKEYNNYAIKNNVFAPKKLTK